MSLPQEIIRAKRDGETLSALRLLPDPELGA